MRLKSLGYMASIVLSAVSFAIMLMIIVSPALFWVQIQSIDTQKLLDLSKASVFYNYMELLHYLVNPFINILKLSDIPVSNMGAFHFMEVKHLFLFNGACAIVFMWLSLKGIHWFDRRGLGTWVRKTLYACLIGLGALVCVIGLGFNIWFEWFHQVIFRNDAWLFNPQTDPIILVLPETFFLICFVAIMLFVAIYFWIVQRYVNRKK